MNRIDSTGLESEQPGPTELADQAEPKARKALTKEEDERIKKEKQFVKDLQKMVQQAIAQQAKMEEKDRLTPEQLAELARLLEKMQKMGGVVGALSEDTVKLANAGKLRFKKSTFPNAFPPQGETPGWVAINPGPPEAMLGAAALRNPPNNRVDTPWGPFPPAGDEIPDPKTLKDLDYGSILVLGHELGHAVVGGNISNGTNAPYEQYGLTDYFDPATLAEMAKEFYEKNYKEGRLPTTHAYPGGLNWYLEQLIRQQLGIPPRKSYAGSMVPDKIPRPEEIAAAEVKRFERELRKLTTWLKDHWLPLPPN